MKYSEYKLEQIVDSKIYTKLCTDFFDHAKSEEELVLLRKILFDGGVENYGVSSGVWCKNNPAIERDRRISVASLIANDIETFKTLKENNINIFHGTNANALPSILKYGLNSVDLSKEKDIEVTTGEEWSRIEGKRSFISFTDVLEIALRYSRKSSTNEYNDLSFGVIIGTTKEEIEKAQMVIIESDISEIGIRDHFPLEGIKCICVPNEKVEFVKKIVNNEDILVLGMTNLKNEEIKEEFSNEDIEEVAKSRNLFGISKMINKLKKTFGIETDKSKQIENMLNDGINNDKGVDKNDRYIR